jgi:hypothetical protein
MENENNIYMYIFFVRILSHQIYTDIGLDVGLGGMVSVTDFFSNNFS